MITKLRNRRYINKKIKVDVEELINVLTQIRKVSDVLAICPQPTGNSWQGVLSATEGLFHGNTFKLPQYYSNPVYTEKEFSKILSEIINLGFRKVVFSGFPLYFKILIDTLNEKGFNSIWLIYHGSFSSNREDEITSKMLYEILSYAKTGKVKRLGFVKKGMSETINKLTGIEAMHIRLFTHIPDGITPKSLDKNKINIGVLTHNQYRKNIDNQIAAALMVDNAIIHTRKNYDFEYTFNLDRLYFHPYFDTHSDFISLLAAMDVNMYVTFSECFGQVITESMAVGVPCLAADNSGIFDFDQELHDLLVVNYFDNSNEIYKKLNTLINIKNKQNLEKKLRDYVYLLNAKAKNSIVDFLS